MNESSDLRFDDIVTLENIYKAWTDFRTGKTKKKDVQCFTFNLEEELIELFENLKSGNYIHGKYECFIVNDPKRRIIHKATVRDRIVHRLTYNALIPIFNRQWMDCSFSCRPGFGQHKSLNSVRKGLGQATRNWSKDCWALKCDIQKYFDSIDHDLLLNLLSRKVKDNKIQQILHKIICSFATTGGCGLPIGNLTSQVFANIYLHELDRFMKHTVKQHWYYRYADDMLVLCQSKDEANAVLEKIENFLQQELRLHLHPSKTILRKSVWGIDWLGRVILPGHEVLRPSTRRRMIRNVENTVGYDYVSSKLASYNGLLKGSARRSIDNFLIQTLALEREE